VARGSPGGWTVTNIAAGHSGENSFGTRLAVAEWLSRSYLQAWRDRPIGSVSHLKKFWSLPPRLWAAIAGFLDCAERR